MRTILVLLFASILFKSLGQGNVTHSPSAEKINSQVETWRFGEIYMFDGEIVSAEFTLNPIIPGGLLRVKTGGREITLTPKQVKRFTFKDERDVLREFYSFQTSRNHHQFLEVIFSGKALSLFGLETIRISQFTSDNYKSSNTRGIYKLLVFDMENQKFSELEKKLLMKRFPNHKTLIKEKAKQLDLSDKKEASLFIQYCDSLIVNK